MAHGASCGPAEPAPTNISIPWTFSYEWDKIALMKSLTLTVCFVFLLCIPHISLADTIYLKSGQKVQGQIVDDRSYYINVMSGGVPYKYYKDQIERIERDLTQESLITDIDASQYSEIASSKVYLIIKYLEINGTREAIENNMKQIIAKAPIQKRAELEAIFDIDDFMAVLVPIYDNHFEEDELKKLKIFYESPLGQKMLTINPELMKETMQASMHFFTQKVQ